METYKIGKKKVKVTLPSGWHEVPFHKAITIFESNMDEVETMAFLGDIDKSELLKCEDAEAIYYLMNAFLFVKRLPANLDDPELPLSVKFKDQVVPFPKVKHKDLFDLGRCSVGQVKDMEMHIDKMIKEHQYEEGDEIKSSAREIDSIKLAPTLVAIYIQKIIDGEYDYEKAMNLVSDVETMSAKDVINIGYFFLLRLSAYKLSILNSSPNPTSLPKKGKRGLNSLMKSLGLTPP